jgi:small redox-active disulfide protein 2
MQVKILGSGCAKCKTLYTLVDNTAKELNISISLQKVEDMKSIMSYGMINTPAMVIEDKVVYSGGIPSKDEVILLLCR